MFDYKALKEQLGDNLVTRFAPSPTGFLHLGHVASALYVWGLAARLGARVDLRIEDHDIERSKVLFEKQILDDLKFLGFLDLPETRDIYKQSKQKASFQESLEELKEKDFIYPCTCSRKEILKRVEQKSGELIYDGFCSKKNIKDEVSSSLRLHIKEPSQSFDDLLCGSIDQRIDEQCGDFTLKDRKGFWTYQYSVVLSDMASDVNLVIRGEDLLPSTGRQMYLRKILGAKPKTFYLHHPLIQDESGLEKLSKKNLSLSLVEQRSQGDSAEILLGKAAYLVGLQREEKPFDLKDRTSLFI